jgi:5-methyltetrahydropteroyltriglutamate--homocysteine methyltransferase
MPPTARAETVGSLLRSKEIYQARTALAEGKKSAADLKAVEDAAIRDAIKLQTDVGLDVVSDGELRRQGWNPSTSFLPNAPFEGYKAVDDHRITYMKFWRDASGQIVNRTLGPASVISTPLKLRNDIATNEYGFTKANANGKRTKYTFTAPSYHRHFWHPVHSKDAYPTVDAYLEAVVKFIRQNVVDKLVAMGCDYIQIDAPNYGQAYTDPDVRAAFEAEGHDLKAEVIKDAEYDNALFEGLSGVTRAIHVCRGNGGGGFWSASGGYEHFAADMFPRLTNVDTLLLEYDSDRAGGFEPLQHVRKDTTAVLGLLTTKSGALEPADQVEGRVREATKYLPLEQLALSTQCGFASSGAGNPLTQDEQFAKLQLVCGTAHKLWG